MNKDSVKFFPLELSYETLDSGEIEVNLFGITLNRDKVIVSDSFSPYFWIIPKKKSEARKLHSKIKNKNLVTRTEVKDKKFLKRDVKAIKVVAKNTSDIQKVRNEVKKLDSVDKTREFDVSLRKKYLIDKKITPYTLHEVEGEILKKEIGIFDFFVKSESIKQVSSDLLEDPRVLAFDIETLCEGPAPNSNEDPIIMCSFYGSGNFKRVITWKKIRDAPDYVKIVGGEEELITEIVKTIREFDPEFLLGYGSDFFDFPYIRDRAKKYKVKLKLGWDRSEPITKLRGRRGTTKIKGITHLDLSRFIRNILGRSLESERFNLNRVGKELVGVGKSLDLSEISINELWSGSRKEILKLIKYNLQDSEIAFKIGEKVLPTQFQLAKILGLTLFDIDRMRYSQLVEQLLLKNAPDFNQISPRRPKRSTIRGRRKNTYTGGFVFEPQADLYENIGSFDYRSLYPSLISAYNIGPTTVNCKCCKDSSKKIEVNDTEYWFCKKKKGFLSHLIKDLVDRRKRVKEILKDTKETDPSYRELESLSYALKTLANSSYGYLGYPGSRWYCLECAKSITSLGRKYIDKVIKTARKSGFETIYADTDGAFILLKDKEKKVKEFLEKINSTLPDPMELEYENKYERGLFLEKKSGGGGAKKRYALLSEDGEIILKGIEAIRGDWSPLAKKAQKKVIKIILKEKSIEKAVKYIQNLVNKVKNREVSVYDLALKTTLTKDLEEYESKGPHVAAAEIARKKGYNVGSGFTVSYIVGKGSGRINERVKLTEDAERKDYDPEYYIDNQIIRAVYKIFDLFGYSEEKLKSGQSSLNNW